MRETETTRRSILGLISTTAVAASATGIVSGKDQNLKNLIERDLRQGNYEIVDEEVYAIESDFGELSKEKQQKILQDASEDFQRGKFILTRPNSSL